MEIFLQRHKLENVTQGAIKNLNKVIRKKNIELVN